MYLVKTPGLIQKLFPRLIWRVPSADKTIFLTFDDGPVPTITPWVLGQLNKFDAKATFFCVGENVEKHPELYAEVLAAGHSVGNHTYHHLNGWKTGKDRYLKNVEQCSRLVNSGLFRPPYGKLSPGQTRLIQCKYRIVLWDVLSGDFDSGISAEQCLKNVLDYTGSGSIVVFHDSLQAWERLKTVLPEVLNHFMEKGYRFESLGKDVIGRQTVYSPGDFEAPGECGSYSIRFSRVL